MKILYLDCFAGISGDMALGALIDAGVPLEVVRDAVAALGVPPERLDISTRAIVRSQIHATKLDVVDAHLRVLDPATHEQSHGHEHDHGHTHDRPHEHPYEHADEHAHGHPHTHNHVTDVAESSSLHLIPGDAASAHEHRTFAQIERMIAASGLAPRVVERSVEIFRQIALAEGRIHDMPPDAVHFHEVGALDSIADIVGFAAALEHLGVDEVYASTVPLGSGGTIRTQHGTMPLPSPATLEILKGIPVRLTDIPFELTTPTGAGIIKALSCGTLSLDEILVDRVGYGAGTRELPDRPNLLRAVIGQRVAQYDRDAVVVIEANVDDLNPQVFGYVFERLLQAGANDCFVTPVLMKKGRPGHLLTVLAPTGALEEVSRIVFAETSTIGLRYRETSRLKLWREDVLVSTEFGTVRMKRVRLHGEVRTTPEYDDARRIAIEHGLPLPQVLRRLQAAADASSRM